MEEAAQILEIETFVPLVLQVCFKGKRTYWFTTEITCSDLSGKSICSFTVYQYILYSICSSFRILEIEILAPLMLQVCFNGKRTYLFAKEITCSTWICYRVASEFICCAKTKQKCTGIKIKRYLRETRCAQST